MVGADRVVVGDGPAVGDDGIAGGNFGATPLSCDVPTLTGDHGEGRAKPRWVTVRYGTSPKPLCHWPSAPMSGASVTAAFRTGRLDHDVAVSRVSQIAPAFSSESRRWARRNGPAPRFGRRLTERCSAMGRQRACVSHAGSRCGVGALETVMARQPPVTLCSPMLWAVARFTRSRLRRTVAARWVRCRSAPPPAMPLRRCRNPERTTPRRARFPEPDVSGRTRVMTREDPLGAAEQFA